jgi:hypothetical protein
MTAEPAHVALLQRDRQQVDQLLDKAERLVGSVDVEAWGTACLRTPNYVEVQRATCYGRLGLVGEANKLWEQIIPAAPSGARRDIGVWSARQAAAAAALHEPERAVDLTRQAAGVILETGSVRARKELAAVQAAMLPWQAQPVGKQLADAPAPINEE